MLRSSSGMISTGVAVDQRRIAGAYLVLVLTCRHAGNPGDTFKAQSQGLGSEPGREMSGGVVWEDHPTEDVRIVAFTTQETYAQAKIAFSVPVFSEEIFVVGFPAGVGPWLVEGVMTEEGRGSAPVYSGNSGGPVLNSDGVVIGLVESILMDYSSIIPVHIMHAATFTPLSKVEDWMREKLTP